ncbi:MAG: alpha/beta hydrolase [Pseudomonadota bacterium]
MFHWERQGSGKDVVLVHGFLGTGEIFEPLTRYLQKQFRVTTLDLPGFGRSRDLPVPDTVTELSHQVAQTIRSSGLQTCSILGHSLGAWIALELSLQQPDLLEKMVLYGGSPDGICPDRFETYENSIERIKNLGVDRFAGDLAAEWFVKGKQDPLYCVAEKAGKNANEAAAIAHVASWNAWKTSDRLTEVNTKTLIICGDSDRSTHPDLSIGMWQQISGSHLFIAPDSGHIVHLEQAEIFNRSVSQFLTDTA